MQNTRRGSWWVLRCGIAVMLVCLMLYGFECFWGVGWATKGGYFVAISDGYVGGGWDGSLRSRPGLMSTRSRIRNWWIYSEFSSRANAIALPLWMPCVACLPFTLWAWRQELRAKRDSRTGFCAKCSYDRRGIESHLRCPECGANSVTLDVDRSEQTG